MKRTLGGIAIVAAFVLILSTYGAIRLSNAGKSPSELLRVLSWRIQIYLMKARGDVPELSWGDLWAMTSIEGGFGLEDVIKVGISVPAAVSNPYVRREDNEAGAQIFKSRCALCHGENGRGFHAPPLDRLHLKHGDNDLDIYRILEGGINGTEMAAADLSFLERWRVVGYLRTLRARSAGLNERQAFGRDIQVTSHQIEMPDNNTDKWLTYSGSLNGWRYAALSEITPANVSQLRMRWVHQFNTNEQKFESTPLVADGVMFITEPPASVVALNAMTGEEIWRYDRSIPAGLPVCCGNVNRGLAVLGNTLFFGSLDGYLVAINANTGRQIWQARVAKPSDGYSLTGAPLVVNHSVVIGVSGGEFGIRGFLAAYDTATGEMRWKFETIPGPGEPGHETWESDAWRIGGGPTWVTGSYDPVHDILFWGVGNPSPPFSGEERPGDNLYTDSVIALNATTGKLAWHFQFTPHDEHDWDSTQTPILANLLINGAERQVICWPNRNGFYYVLDRLTGEFLVGTPFVEQNWATGLNSAGRPILAVENEKVGHIVRPGYGGVNWQPSAFDPTKGIIYIPATEDAAIFTKSAKQRIRRGNTGALVGSGASSLGPRFKTVRALDAATGAKRWEYRLPPSETYDSSGLLATAGGVVFGAFDKTLFALDSASGVELWHVVLGGEVFAPPISFTLGGKQVIAVLAGRAMFMFGL